MDPEKKDTPVVEDESVLDKELETTISAIKAGQAPEAPKPEVKPGEEPKKAETPTEEPKKAEESSNPPSEDVVEFKLPIPDKKSKFESDEVYEKRVELMGLIQKKRLARTDDQKKELAEKIKETRTEMSLLKGSDKINNLNKVVEEPKKPEEEDPALKADKERLKALGGATTEDIQEMLRQERLQIETKNTLEGFVSRHPELKDPDVRDVFFDYVDTNYNWQGKTGKDLMTVLELARESMFKPSETVQERVLKAANVAEKVNSMQFPGGSGAGRSDMSPEMRKSVDELKATGMSEEKAIELLSD